jgi:hypothetical protein
MRYLAPMTISVIQDAGRLSTHSPTATSDT